MFNSDLRQLPALFGAFYLLWNIYQSIWKSWVIVETNITEDSESYLVALTLSLYSCKGSYCSLYNNGKLFDYGYGFIPLIPSINNANENEKSLAAIFKPFQISSYFTTSLFFIGILFCLITILQFFLALCFSVRFNAKNQRFYLGVAVISTFLAMAVYTAITYNYLDGGSYLEGFWGVASAVAVGCVGYYGSATLDWASEDEHQYSSIADTELARQNFY
jgi:hypothetical protein